MHYRIVRPLLVAALLGLGAVSFTPLNDASPRCPGAITCIGGPNWDEVPDPADADKNDVPCPGTQECPPHLDEEAPGEVPHPSN